MSPPLLLRCLIPGLAILSLGLGEPGTQPAPRPLYRDPVHDGAADPVVVWNPHAGRWWMFYTNRRANVPGLHGVTWVHGTRIGIAESADGGTTWTHAGTAEIELPPEVAGDAPTLWAPEIVTAAQAGCHLMGDAGAVTGRADEWRPLHHLFLTVVPGVFADWGHPRRIVHLTSTDLRRWSYRATLPLGSDRVIDAAVHRRPDGTWRLWYNDERANKAIRHADSPDLRTWTDRGLTAGVEGRPGEGPVVFNWRGRHWMLVDHWRGLGVYHSDDLETWTAQGGPDLLSVPGNSRDDGVNGGHAGVVVSGDRAFLFYFTHPGRAGTVKPTDPGSPELRRSSIQVVELRESGGVLSCDRDAPVHVHLEPPADPDALPNPLIRHRADPHVSRQPDGHYYFMGTVPEYDRLVLRRATTLAGLATAVEKVVWRRRGSGPMGAHLWAPELHRIGGRWYIYFAAGEAERIWNIRLHVLENAAANPLEGEWSHAGQLDTGWDSFALDATVFVHRGRRHLIWAQKDPAIPGNSNLYIAPLAAPTRLAGPAVLLSRPEHAWEKVRYAVNEGPVVLRGQDRLFLTYSAAGTGPEYAVGLLTAAVDADLLDPRSWTKSPEPVFRSSEANGIFGPGHHSFTRADDGVTDVIVYHARSYREITGNPLRDPNRHTRLQRVRWRADGTPDFGEPRPDDEAAHTEPGPPAGVRSGGNR